MLDARVWNAYGATETGTTCIATPADRRRSPTTVGRPLTGVRLRVLGPDEGVVARGVEGVVEVDSPLRVGRPFRGDRGLVDAAGLLHITGRSDGRVVSGGETSDPRVLRRWLESLPEVAEAVVEPVADARFGTRLVATVTPARGAGVDPGRLRTRVRSELGPALTPREVRVARP